MRTRITGRLTGGLAIIGLAVLTACGAGPTLSTPATDTGLTTTPTPTTTVGRSVPKAATTVAELSRLVSTSTGKADTAQVTQRLSVVGNRVPDNGAIPLSETGPERFGAARAANVTLTGPDVGPTTMVQSDGRFYLRTTGDLAMSYYVNGAWAEVEPGSDNFSEAQLDSAYWPVLTAAAAQADPAAVIRGVVAAGTITSADEEDLAGQPVTHYTISVDVPKLAATLSASAGRSLRTAYLNQSTIGDQLWLDSADRPVKLVAATFVDTDPVKNEAAPVATTDTVTYADWGQPVSVTAPPPSQLWNGSCPATMPGTNPC